MNKKLLIIGTEECYSVVNELAVEMEEFDEIRFEDIKPCIQATGLRTTFNDLVKLRTYKECYSHAIPAISDPEIRLKVFNAMENEGFIIPILVSRMAYISPSAQLQSGDVIEPFAAIYANAMIEKCVYVSSGTVINHNAYVCAGSYIGSNSVVMPGALITAKTSTMPCEVLNRVPLNLKLDANCRIVNKNDGKFNS